MPDTCKIQRYHATVTLTDADSFVYDRYRDLLLENSAQMQLSDEEQKMYLNRADFFCMDVYGNPDLYHIILYLNNCGELDFHPSVVRYLIPESVEDVLKVIMSKETSNIQKSRKKVMG